MKKSLMIVIILCTALSTSALMAGKLPTEAELKEKGFSELQIAARTGDISRLKEALKNGEDINRMVGSYEFENTALFQAVLLQQKGSVKFLLDHGANPNFCGWKSMSPLHVAALHGDQEIVDQLLKAGAYLDYRNAPDHGDFTALTVAIESKNNDIVKKLLRAGANPNMTTYDSLTPMHIAAKEGNSKAAKLLVIYRADAHRLDKKGRNPSQLASEQGFLELAEYLRDLEKN